MLLLVRALCSRALLAYFIIIGLSGSLFSRDSPLRTLLKTYCRLISSLIALSNGRGSIGRGTAQKQVRQSRQGQANEPSPCWRGLLSTGYTLNYNPRFYQFQDRKFFDSADHEMGAAGVKKEGTGHVIATAQTVPKRGPAPRTSALVTLLIGCKREDNTVLKQQSRGTGGLKSSESAKPAETPAEHQDAAPAPASETPAASEANTAEL